MQIIIQLIRKSGEILGRLVGPLLKTGLSLIENIVKPLAESVLIPLGLKASASATGAAIHKKMYITTLIISNEEMNDIMKIFESREESGLLIKSVSETIRNEGKEQKGGFLSMFLGILGASLIGILVTGKNTIRAGEDINSDGQDF